MIASLYRLAWAGSAAFALLTVAPLRANAAEPAPLDGVCAWGRLSDGRGRLIRCLTREEAERLRDAAPAPNGSAVKPPPAATPAEQTPVPPTAPTQSGEVRPPGPAAAQSPNGPASNADAPITPPATPAPAAADAVSVDVDVGPIVTDSGSLPDAQKHLKKARDRIAACIDRGGSLSAERGSVELRFLVQRLGRVEGVSMKKHRGLSDTAARCVASVIDRRYVGYPDEPAVAATVVVTLSKKRH